MRALGVVCAGVSCRAEIRFEFLGLFLAWSLPLPNRRGSVSRESESVGSRLVQKWPVLAGGARIPSSRE